MAGDDSEVAAQIGRVVAGDAGALDVLARRWMRPAYLIAMAHLGRAADAEDLAQEVVTHALARIEGCREPARGDAWFAALARNRARNALRRRRLLEVVGVLFRGAPPESRSDDPSARLDVEEAVAALPIAQREVLLLHDVEGWSHAEIARNLGLSEVNCRQLLFVARRALRARLRLEGPDGG